MQSHKWVQLAVLCMTLLVPVTAAAQGFIVLGSEGTYARGTFPGTDGWLGLVCNGTDCSLQDVAVSITPSQAANIVDEEEPTEVLQATPVALALIRGVPKLSAGKVVTWYRRGEDDDVPPGYASLHALGFWKIAWGKNPLMMSAVRKGYEIEYHLTDRKTTQTLLRTETEGHYGGTTTPEIRWIGDLDRDGAADIVLNLPDDNCGFAIYLYLSSAVTDGEVLHRAAALEGREPACGC